LKTTTLTQTQLAWLNEPANRSIAILAVLYAVGLASLLGQLHEDFILLTPFNLLISLALMLWHHPGWSGKTIAFLVITYLVGFGAEVFGVQTGLLFGHYEYGRVLGWKIAGTPLMIGVNWVMLAYCAGVTVNYLAQRWHWLVKAALASVLMVGLDVLIEPVAIEYGFWTWTGDGVPLLNYGGWFLVAFPLLSLFNKWQGALKNKVAPALFLLQIIFFLTLGIF